MEIKPDKKTAAELLDIGLELKKKVLHIQATQWNNSWRTVTLSVLLNYIILDTIMS